MRLAETWASSGLVSEARAPNDLGGRDGGNKHWKAAEFIVPPVGANKGLAAPPELAVLGDQGGSDDQMVAPRRQQFTGDFDYDPAKEGGKPLPVRPYAADQPSAYQAAPLWPPAPPEPLFPLKGDSGDSAAMQPPLPGGFSPMAARL